MALTCSQKSLDSPFSHKELYGVEHPITRKHSSGTKSKPHSILRGSDRKTKTTDSSSKRSKERKKKKDISAKSAKSTHSQVHAMHGVSPSGCGLASLDPMSPVRTSTRNAWGSKSNIQTKPTIQDSRRTSQSSSKTSLPSSKTSLPGSKTSLSSSKTGAVSHSSSIISTTDVIANLNKPRNNSRSRAVNSPISVSLGRRGVPQAASCPSLGSRLFSTGARRPGDNSLEGIVRGLARTKYRNIVVMTGAGISTPSGIPDFRTPGTGLYDNLQQYKIPDPTAIFDIGYFSRQPRPFFTLAKDLFPGNYQPNTVHYFIKLLQEKGLLLRNYTQNIDGLERIAGLPQSKLVEAHGSFSTASCIKCKTKQDPEEVKAAILGSKIPRCKHKHCYGLVKPDIVFFGEDLPSRFHSLQLRDFSKCDLLIIMGTSLEVEPFASLCTLSRFDVPRLLINRELVGPFKRGRVTDVSATGDLVEVVADIIEGAGWGEELRGLMKSCDQQDGTPDPLEIETVASEQEVGVVSVESSVALLSEEAHPLPVGGARLQSVADETDKLTSRISCLTI